MNTNNALETEIRELIKSLKLTAIVMEIFNDNISDPLADELLKYSYSKPYSILDLSTEEQQVYQVDRYKPILEFDSGKILAYDLKNSGFVFYSLEEGINNPECITWDGAFLEEVSIWWENEWSDKEIHFAGKNLGLKYTREIVQSLESIRDGAGPETFEAKDAWIKEMLETLNLKCKTE